MNRISTILIALILVLGLSQCKKQEKPSVNEEIVPITLDVRAQNGSRIYVDPETGRVSFEEDDVVYVASGNKFVGTLTNNGSTFAGNLTNPTVGEPLYFFFLGNKTPEETLVPGSSTTCSVNISDQTSRRMPVISFATSNETFTGAGLYTAFFLNKAALVKFNIATLSSSPTIITGLNNKVTVDFSTNAFNYSQVDNGCIKTYGISTGLVSDADYRERWLILLPQNEVEEGALGSVYTEDGVFSGIRPALPAISCNDYLSEGIAVTVATEVNPVPVPTGAVSGKFLINRNGDRICFAKGNLQFTKSTNTWSFMENQYDMVETNEQNVGENYANQDIVSLFGWATSGYNHGAICYQPWSTSTNVDDYYAYGESYYGLNQQTGQADWGYNAISNGGNMEEEWRTLTANEWRHLLSGRPTLSDIYWALGKVNNVNGLILLPDDWDASIYTLNNPYTVYHALGYSNAPSIGGFDSNIITNSDWINFFEANGAVFLPIAGYRMGESVERNTIGLYWSSSFYLTYPNQIAHVRITESNVFLESIYSPLNRTVGRSVRLAHDLN